MLGRALLSLLLVGILTKPVYDHKRSNVQMLTGFNFKDQVTKLRQTTNYVTIVHFSKFDGTNKLI